jgi:hypothetical protein
MSSPFAALRRHSLFAVAQELKAQARPRRRRHAAPEALNPHYAHGNTNEQPTLEQLVAAEPPNGGMAAYIAELDKPADERGLPHPHTVQRPVLTDRQLAMRARWSE